MNMNNSRINAFSILVLAGAILFGCGAISQNSYRDGAIAIGCILMPLGLLSVFLEATNLWGKSRDILRDFITGTEVQNRPQQESDPDKPDI